MVMRVADPWVTSFSRPCTWQGMATPHIMCTMRSSTHSSRMGTRKGMATLRVELGCGNVSHRVGDSCRKVSHRAAGGGKVSHSVGRKVAPSVGRKVAPRVGRKVAPRVGRKVAPSVPVAGSCH